MSESCKPSPASAASGCPPLCSWAHPWPLASPAEFACRSWRTSTWGFWGAPNRTPTEHVSLRDLWCPIVVCCSWLNWAIFRPDKKQHLHLAKVAEQDFMRNRATAEFQMFPSRNLAYVCVLPFFLRASLLFRAPPSTPPPPPPAFRRFPGLGFHERVPTRQVAWCAGPRRRRWRHPAAPR